MKNGMWRILVAAAASVVLFGITGPKLYKMIQIKGWIGGAQTTEVIISQKWHQLPTADQRQREAYWISWGDKSIKEVGGHRKNVNEEVWVNIQKGDAIQIVHVPGDKWPYLKDGIFTETGNFILDGILLMAELFVCIFFSTTGILEIRRRRA